MLKVNLARVLVVSAVMVSSSLGGLAPAQAQSGEPLYERIYYDDANHTTQVGYERDTCNYYGVGGGQTIGIETPYYDSIVFAYCDNGVLVAY